MHFEKNNMNIHSHSHRLIHLQASIVSQVIKSFGELITIQKGPLFFVCGQCAHSNKQNHTQKRNPLSSSTKFKILHSNYAVDQLSISLKRLLPINSYSASHNN